MEQIFLERTCTACLGSPISSVFRCVCTCYLFVVCGGYCASFVLLVCGVWQFWCKSFLGIVWRGPELLFGGVIESMLSSAVVLSVLVCDHGRTCHMAVSPVSAFPRRSNGCGVSSGEGLCASCGVDCAVLSVTGLSISDVTKYTRCIQWQFLLSCYHIGYSYMEYTGGSPHCMLSSLSDVWGW